ncbi:MAG: hypothetical protein GC199_08795 [Alphaproteobacteria bacterium]|nr:hypothetical protein [Alphaproteobacteria bacterium]
MRRSAVLGALALALGLAGCASPTPYVPASKPGTPGYGERQIDTNRFRVTFTGNSATPRQTVETFLLLRAADLTLAQGFDFFLLEAQDVDSSTVYRSDFDAWPRAGFYWSDWHWGRGFGASVSTTSRPITSYSAYADVIMLTAAQAAGDPHALNARTVQQNLRAQSFVPGQ